jgi:hypothetical protein
MNKPEGNLNLRYQTPVVIGDGHVVMISDQGVPTLLFFILRLCFLYVVK